MAGAVPWGEDGGVDSGRGAVIFHHLYKCAGSTLHDVLRRSFGAGYFHVDYQDFHRLSREATAS